MTDLTPLSREAIGRLTADTEPWLSCDDCFEQVDVVIDAVMGSSGAIAEEFRTHLLCCPACHEEARALAAIVAADYELSQTQATTRLDAAILGVDA